MNKLKRIRDDRTQAEMAKILDISKSYYEKLERESVPVTRKILEKIKKYNEEIDVNIFFGKEEQ